MTYLLAEQPLPSTEIYSAGKGHIPDEETTSGAEMRSYLALSLRAVIKMQNQDPVHLLESCFIHLPACATEIKQRSMCLNPQEYIRDDAVRFE